MAMIPTTSTRVMSIGAPLEKPVGSSGRDCSVGAVVDAPVGIAADGSALGVATTLSVPPRVGSTVESPGW